MIGQLDTLPEALLPWYETHKRDLPWRQDADPYHIWVSEIMLQQTRVEAVKGYYVRFLKALPTISDLAMADEGLLLKLWEGLGYYSRVRNLQKAARIILEEHGGQFPREHNAVLALPGIGDYTAGAICSIAFGLKTPAVDGNVLRVISRIQADFSPIDTTARKKEVQSLLTEIYPEQAGDFTQALMELGATICGPNKAPDCEICPCKDFCKGFAQGVAPQLPIKSPKKGRRVEEKTLFLLRCNDKYALQRRPETGLLAGLWQLPEVPGILDVPAALEQLALPVRQVHRQLDKNHIFTHIEWKMRCIYLEIAENSQHLQWFTKEEIEKFTALPTAYRQFWEARGDF